MTPGLWPDEDPISEQANKAVIESVKKDHPQSFTVGAHADILARKGEATIRVDRTWRSGWGATAYIRGWWNDTAVVPQEKHGIVVGGEGSFKF